MCDSRGMRNALLALLCLTALPAAAQVFAVQTLYCGGRLIAEQFETRVTPGAQGRAEYFVTLRNPAATPLRYQLQFVADALGKPYGQFTLTAGQRRPQALGYALNMQGRSPLRGQALADALRVSCS